MTFTTAQTTSILRLKSELLGQFSVKMAAIIDPKFQSLITENCIITGGAISSCFFGEKINDIDLYAKDIDSMNLIKTYILNYLQPLIKVAVNTYNLDDTSKIPLVTDNAVTLIGNLQFIYLGTADQCRPQFDFIHCMPWFDLKSQTLHISKDQYNSIVSKHMKLNVDGELIKLRRIEKYFKRGWTIDNEIYKRVQGDVS